MHANLSTRYMYLKFVGIDFKMRISTKLQRASKWKLSLLHSIKHQFKSSIKSPAWYVNIQIYWSSHDPVDNSVADKNSFTIYIGNKLMFSRSFKEQKNSLSTHICHFGSKTLTLKSLSDMYVHSTVDFLIATHLATFDGIFNALMLV